jgi:NTE family protein
MINKHNFSSLAGLQMLALAVCIGFLAGCKTAPVVVERPTPPVVEPPPVAAPPVVIAPLRPLRIGLALGGGAARGFAHIGVIKVLEAQGLTPDIVTGTSAGSLVGALYASGMTGFTLQQTALAMDEAALADWTLSSRGMLKGDALQNYVNRSIGNRAIDKFAKPFGAVATDFGSGGAITFTRGNAGQAVRASSSIPGVFAPVRIDGHDYVDGGLISPVPALAARQLGADFVIAVDISARPKSGEIDSLPSTLAQTIAIMGKGLRDEELRKHADVVIVPDVDRVSGTDFTARNLLILAGEQAASNALANLRLKIEQMKKAKNLR